MEKDFVEITIEYYTTYGGRLILWILWILWGISSGAKSYCALILKEYLK